MTRTANENAAITVQQLEAVQRYASIRGRRWKEKLRDDWTHARTGGALQELRNTHGPCWLDSFKLPRIN